VETRERIKVYLKDAWEFYRRGAREVKEGLERKDSYLVRDGAEKLWNAVIQATNALVLSLLGTTPASHWERRRKLYELEESYEIIERLGLSDRYSARERHLHGLTFYEGIIDEELLRREIIKVERYLKDVEKILKEKA